MAGGPVEGRVVSGVDRRVALDLRASPPVRYHVLACDYDGTLAANGQVDPRVLERLHRLRDTGRRLVLVTGRHLEDLLALFPEVVLFDRVVAENGAVVYDPDSREETALAGALPAAFTDALHRAGIAPLRVGRVIVSTWQPHETTVLRLIRDLGLELQVVFNQGAVLVLPPGVNKATGLAAALAGLGLSRHNCVGIGAAENDHAFLALCECAVAVASAVPPLRDGADLVTSGGEGAGVVELIDRLIASDLEELGSRLSRHLLLLGHAVATGEDVRLEPQGHTVLIAGASGSGKSTLTTALLERLKERGYQVCVIDPEGDYTGLPDGIVLGDQRRAPTAAEVLDVLRAPDRDVVVNLLGIALKDRPAFFDGLLPRLLELKARTGRPHWIVVDEAHHLLPPSWTPAALTVPRELEGALLITVHPEHVAPALLATVDVVLAVGRAPGPVLEGFSAAAGVPVPAGAPGTLEVGEALFWATRSGGTAPERFRADPPRAERRRHRRKYAEGELGPDVSFYFRGRDARLNLRAHNLVQFVQLAEGVDDDTWLHHLRCGDYSRWFRDCIKDPELADEALAIERAPEGPADRSRALVRVAIEQRYTLPA
jgi:hydroxymethylpyrimidine pyrophosphatase-like HAD family hydrolase